MALSSAPLRDAEGAAPLRRVAVSASRRNPTRETLFASIETILYSPHVRQHAQCCLAPPGLHDGWQEGARFSRRGEHVAERAGVNVIPIKRAG